MGLDMYLTKRTNVKNWNHLPDKFEVVVLKNGEPLKHFKQERADYIAESVGYWRKANQIHRWFVENVQNGNDDCKEYFVSREQLAELKGICLRVIAGSRIKKTKIKNGYTFETNEKGQAVQVPIMEDGYLIENPRIAEELLPTTEGFFFGSYDYDQYYLQDLKETVKIIDECLEDPDAEEFYYQSSW